MDILAKVQKELIPWQQHNFPDRPSWQPLVGMMEELGELSHSFLKSAQNIRMNEDHYAKAKDAIGDILVYLCDFCNALGWEAVPILEQVWSEVSQRDWRKKND